MARDELEHQVQHVLVIARLKHGHDIGICEAPAGLRFAYELFQKLFAVVLNQQTTIDGPDGDMVAN